MRSLARPLQSFFFFQAEDGIRDIGVTGVQTCALPILKTGRATGPRSLPRPELCLEVSELQSAGPGSPGRIWKAEGLPFDQSDVARAWPFLRILGRKLDTLPFAQQLEHRTPHRAAMEEMFNAALVADKPEPFVDQEPCNCPRRHTRSLRYERAEPALVELEIPAQSRQSGAGSQATAD